MSWATAKQPMSRLTERSKSVADWLVRSGQVSGLEDEILARRSAGIEKYGIELTSHNGRRPLVDAYQEVLDLIVIPGASRYGEWTPIPTQPDHGGHTARPGTSGHMARPGTSAKLGGCRWHRVN